MTRPSRKTDKRLIEAAQSLMKGSGLSQLNLRDVADKADVNLGMFHYHFKTKDQFIKAVLKDTYERFFEHFSLEIEEQKKPLEKLRQALISMAQFSFENRHLVLSLLQDALNRDPSVKDFVRQSMGKHVDVIQKLILECIEQGEIQEAPLGMLMSYIMPASTAHSMVLGLMEHMGADPEHTEYVRKASGNKATIARRVGWVLDGLAVKKAPKTKKKA